MSEKEDLLEKADALLRRYRKGTDADFPVLTEIIEPSPQSRSASGQPGGIDDVAREQPLESSIRHLEERLREQILILVESRISSLANESVRHQFSGRINSLLDKIGEDFTLEVRTKLPSIVQSAVKSVVEGQLAGDPAKVEKP